MTRHSHLLLALAIVVAMPLCMQSGSLASEVLIFGLAAMGCNLLLGYTGLLSFGQGIFFGLGSYTIDAINAQDFSVVRAMVFLGAALYIVGLILADISYTLADPRVRFE